MRTFTMAAIAAGLMLTGVAENASAQGRGYYHSGHYYQYGPYHSGWYGGYGYHHYPYYSSYYYPRFGYGYRYYYPGYTYYYAPSVTYVTPPIPVVIGRPIPQTSTSFYGGAPVDANRVLLRVILPTTDARLFIQGNLVQTTGRERTFISPTMDVGKTFTYALRANWNDGDKVVSREKKVEVQTGHEYVIDFNKDAEPIAAPVPSNQKSTS